MTHECPTHGTIPDAPWCPICDAPEESIREMCRRVLRDWVTAWPDPQRWKHEVRWQEDGIVVTSQRISEERVWSAAAFFGRSELELGSTNIVKWQALQTWRELHQQAQQQGDTC